MDSKSTMSARAFNQGSDARQAGKLVRENPYDANRENRLWQMWREGWKDVDWVLCQSAVPARGCS